VHHDRSAAKAGGERTSVLETTTASFVELRELLFSVVYNLLGTVSDTEDVLQETWLAWASSGREEVANARAYLLRIAVNQALSRLRRERRNRETYVGPWLPEPLATGADAAEGAERAEAVSLAMLVVLETLTPLERTVFVLHEVFGYEHAEIAAILGRRPAAVRQLAHRAREHVQARRPRCQPDPSAQRAATERFLAAAVGGDLPALLEVLAPPT
jgi:RNA polymerase sigma-70 factor (ECF subfamily)